MKSDKKKTKQKKEIIGLYRKKDVAKTFDESRSKYAYQLHKHKIEANLLKKTISDIKSEKIEILDVACGTGRMLPEIFSIKKDIQYYGIDTSKEMIRHLKEKAKRLGIKKKVKIKVPAIHTGKVYGVINQYKEQENWLGDGGLEVVVNVPSGLIIDFYDKLNAVTHGSALTEEIREEVKEK